MPCLCCCWWPRRIACSGRAKRTPAVGGWSRPGSRSASAFWQGCCRPSWCCPASPLPIWSRVIDRWGAGGRPMCRGGRRRVLRWLVSCARRTVAGIGTPLHRRLAAQQHRRTCLGLQRLRAPYRERARRPRQSQLRRRLGPAVRQQHGSGHRVVTAAAVICIAPGFVITRRAPRTDATRAALILWGGWLVVTALVFSFANGILHSYYTVAL